MTYEDRRQTGAADAAAILADLKERVDRLEQERRGGSSTVQLFRNVDETVTVSDSHTVTTQTARFTYNEDEYGFGEWGDH